VRVFNPLWRSPKIITSGKTFKPQQWQVKNLRLRVLAPPDESLLQMGFPEFRHSPE